MTRYDQRTGRRRDETFPADRDHLTAPGADTLLEQAEIAFLTAAEWRCLPGWSVPPRSLTTANYALYVQGRAWLTVAGGERELRAGDLVLIPPGLPHAVRQDQRARVLGRSGHFTARVAGGLDLIGLLGFPLVIDTRSSRDTLLRQLPLELAVLAARRPPGWRAAGAARIHLLLDHLVRHHGSSFLPRPAAGLERLRAALLLAEERWADPLIGITDLAEAAGVSAVRLRQLFHQMVGCPPVVHLQRRRIAHACTMLAAADLAVNDIARKCGFADAGYFHRVFRRITGRTPGTWRATDQ